VLAVWTRSLTIYDRKILSCKIEPFLKSDFVKIDKERARLDAEEDRVNEEIRLYFSRINTILAKTARIWKLRRFLASREAEIIRRGLENIEELEKLEEQEKLYILSALSVTTAIFSKNVSAFFFFSGEFDAFLAQEYSDLFDKNLRLIAGRSWYFRWVPRYSRYI
jgi:predicted RNase H-like nuclease (RuvC/YqgF family)